MTLAVLYEISVPAPTTSKARFMPSNNCRLALRINMPGIVMPRFRYNVFHGVSSRQPGTVLLFDIAIWPKMRPRTSQQRNDIKLLTRPFHFYRFNTRAAPVKCWTATDGIRSYSTALRLCFPFSILWPSEISVRHPQSRRGNRLDWHINTTLNFWSRNIRTSIQVIVTISTA